MNQQHRHRTKSFAPSLSWVFLPGIALVAEFLFLLVQFTFDSTAVGAHPLWLFVWLVSILTLGRLAILFFERRIRNASALGSQLQYMKRAQEVRPDFEVLVEKIVRWFNLAVLVFAAAIAVAGWLLGGLTQQAAVERFTAILLVAAPQAILLSIPTVSKVATAVAAYNQIYYSSRAQFEALGSVDMVLFDKTGTLTVSERRFIGAHLAHGSPLVTTDELVAIAAGVETHSDHPIAVAIMGEAASRNLAVPEVRDFRQIPGQGVTGTFEAQTFVVGGPIILTSRNITPYVGDLVKVDASNHAGLTVIFVIRDAELLGWIELNNHVHANSRHTILALKRERKRVALLTGDAHGAAAAIGQEVGIAEIFAEVLPHQKAELVNRLQADSSRIAMVGDGLNDATALQQTEVVVAVGVNGYEPVTSAGIMIASTDPILFAQAFLLSTKAKKKMRQNLIGSVIFTLLTLPLAAGALAGSNIILSPIVAVTLSFAMVMGVLFNSRSLRRV